MLLDIAHQNEERERGKRVNNRRQGCLWGLENNIFLKDYAPDGNTKKRLDQETKKEKHISRMQTNKLGKCKCTIKRPSVFFSSFFSFLFFFLSRSLFFLMSLVRSTNECKGMQNALTLKLRMDPTFDWNVV